MDPAIEAALQVAGGVLTALTGFFLGRFKVKARAASHKDKLEIDERQRLFDHYNELIASGREMNHSLRNELAVVRNQMHALQVEHAKETAAAAQERQECKVENERLKAELKHLKIAVAEMKEDIARYRESQEG